MTPDAGLTESGSVVCANAAERIGIADSLQDQARQRVAMGAFRGVRLGRDLLFAAGLDSVGLCGVYRLKADC